MIFAASDVITRGQDPALLDGMGHGLIRLQMPGPFKFLRGIRSKPLAANTVREKRSQRLQLDTPGDQRDQSARAVILKAVILKTVEAPSSSRVTRNARPLLRAEERAIVRRMSNENTEVKSFFTRYEAANAIFDVEQIAACYAEVFMFGGPAGVQCVKKEDFLKVLPRRKEFFRSRGLVSSNIDSLAVSTLDSKYTLVKVVFYEKVLNVKDDVATILNSFGSAQEFDERQAERALTVDAIGVHSAVCETVN